MESGAAKWTSEEIFDASAKLGQEAAADIKRLNRVRDLVLGWLQALTLIIAYMSDWLFLAVLVEVPLFLALMYWLRRKPYEKADVSMDLLVQGARTRRRELTAVKREQSARLRAALATSDEIYFERPDGRIEVVAADLGDGSTVVEVLDWLVEPGQTLKEGGPIANVLYDSWTLEFVAPSDCRIEQVVLPASKEAPIGAPLCILTPALSPGLST